jgi:hypothetical protein
MNADDAVFLTKPENEYYGTVIAGLLCMALKPGYLSGGEITVRERDFPD